jgi:hypothetical protein
MRSSLVWVNASYQKQLNHKEAAGARGWLNNPG